jgi:hypothetical protein
LSERGYVYELQTLSIYDPRMGLAGRREFLLAGSIFCALFQQEQADEGLSGILHLKSRGVDEQPRLTG